MKFSFLFYEPIEALAELDRRMALLAAMGYEGVELSAFHPLPYPIASVAALAEKHGLPVVSMLSGWSYSEGLCLSSPDATIRDRAVNRLIGYVSQAATLKCLIVVGLMQGLRSDEPDELKANDRIVGGLCRVCRVAEQLGVSLVIEPVNHLQVGFNHTVAMAAALADRVGSQSLGVMLDTFHMNIEERSVVDGIRHHAPRTGTFTSARRTAVCLARAGSIFGASSRRSTRPATIAWSRSRCIEVLAGKRLRGRRPRFSKASGMDTLLAKRGEYA